MLNQISLTGRLTRDPELRSTAAGVPLARFSLAVERNRAGAGKTRKTDFIRCAAWRSTGEFVAKYFRKGDMIALTGSLQVNEWKDQDGNRRSSAEVAAESVSFCGRKTPIVVSDPEELFPV